MDIASKLEQLEKEVARLRRWQRRTVLTIATSAIVLGIGYGILGGANVNAKDSEGLSGSSLTITGADAKASVRIVASRPTSEQKGLEGLDFLDSQGKLRAQLYWGHGPSRTTFALYNGNGQIIQALPQN